MRWAEDHLKIQTKKLNRKKYSFISSISLMINLLFKKLNLNSLNSRIL